MIATSLRGRPLRALTELAGLVGAEILGAVGLGLAAALLALTAQTAWIPWLALPVVLSGVGPLGYDMAQSWVPEDERLPTAAWGFRAAAHAAGMAGALVLAAVVVGVAGAAPGLLTVTAAFAALVGLPYLAALGRNLAVRRGSRSKAVLPVALAVILAASPALFFTFALLLGRLFGDD